MIGANGRWPEAARVIAKEDARIAGVSEPRIMTCTRDLSLARYDHHLPDRRPESTV